MRWLSWLVLVGLVGCASAIQFRYPPSIDLDVIVLSADLNRFVPVWGDELLRRFPQGAHCVFCHGLTFGREWYLFPDAPMKPFRADALMSSLAKRTNDGRPWILFACNPGGVPLNVTGVYYAEEEIWLVPDRYCTVARDRWSDDGAGSIWEFVCER